MANTATTDVAHEQPVHASRGGHVADDLAHRLLLAGRELERQALLQPGGELPPVLERRSARRVRGEEPRPGDDQLEVEQLVKG
jgi:hypothetical protein